MPPYVDHLIEVYSQSPPWFGAADICSADSPQSIERAGAFTFLMLLAGTEAQKYVVKNVVVIMPPQEAISTMSHDSITVSIVDAAQRRFCRMLTEQELAAINNHVILVHAHDFAVTSALKALAAASENDAVIILYAASYRTAKAPPPLGSSTSPILQEDQWVPHLVQFASLVTEYAKKANCDVLLDTGEASPHKEENRNALMSVADCGLFTIVPKKDAMQLLAAHSSEWLQQVTEGHVGSVWASIDALPAWMDSQKSFIKLQLLDRVAPGPEVLKMLHAEIDAREYTDPSVRVKMARVAQRADDEDLARDLLKPAISGLTRQDELELALELAIEVTDKDLTDEIAQRLTLLYPTSSKPFERRLAELIDQRHYSDIASLLDGDHAPLGSNLELFYKILGIALQESVNLQYDDVINTISQRVPRYENWARILCAREAIARHAFDVSISLCLPTEVRPLTTGTARMLLQATRQVLLQRNPIGEFVLNGDQLFLPVSALVHFLAYNPTEGFIRVGLANLLSVETAGSLGLAVAISVVLNTASTKTVRARRSRPPLERETPDVDLTSFLQSVHEWMASENPMILRLAKLPASLLVASPDDIFDNLRQLIKFDQDLRDIDTAKAFEQIVYTGVLLAPHTSTPNEDLDLLRYSAARFIAANRLQFGRDLAETALVLAGNAADRRRLAWMAFGDIYHRAHNTIDSLIGIACMFAIDVDIDVEQMWQETYLLVRILRDLYLFDNARSVLNRLKTFEQVMRSPVPYAKRLVTLELGIELSELGRQRGYDAGQLTNLTEQIARHCLELLTAREEVSPGLSLLLHCIHLAKLNDFPASEIALSTVQRMRPKASAALGELMDTILSSAADGRQLLALAKSVESARYHEDVAFDLTNVAIAARRFLDAKVDKESAQAVIFAIEALADHAIRHSLIGSGDSAFGSLGISSERAVAISTAGYRVVFLGLSETGRLVRVTVVDGDVDEVVVETKEMFSALALEEWSQRFPYDYSRTDDPNAFWTSTDKLRLSLTSLLPTIIIMDTALQRLPPNLIRLGQEFAGRVIPIASAPSISWLAEMRKLPASTKTRRNAWIPIGAGAEKDTALVWLAERLRGSLDEHNFALDTGATLPNDLGDSELVVVIAHGGLLPERRFIQRISDGGHFAMYPKTLASGVAGSSVVILFICSGGRIDSHPQAETTVGLVKQLFDKGCATIVASPWPLDVKVPPTWLGSFLQRWSEGDAVIDAVFCANAEVAKSFGGDPVDCLAMNVFGDPLRKKS
jgi:hypothetical protein